jgi:serine/threonine protein kinase/tetratricopeptide (TPR) repeat protein
MKSLQSGDTLKHYRIINKLGQGGMGQVYLAEDKRLGRFVAVKLLPESATQDEKARLRLTQEARAASALNHPNIVTIYSIDDHDGFDFIVMEYVEGETLRAIIERGALALPQLLRVGAQIAEALAAAHAVGIIHRDIKSENILLTPLGQPKVLDFGLAKAVPPVIGEVDKEAPTRIDLTGAGVVLGTVHYMSPEQTRGEPMDARSDIFSFGCVLYEAATGKLPFSGPSMLSIAHNIAATDPPPPSRLNPEIPVEFDMIVERALAKNKEQRYASVADLAEALRTLKGSSENFVSLTESASALSASAEQESFVGRSNELNKLDGLLRRVVEGSGRVVFITGEPGIGKSSLVGEFLRRARKQYPGLLISRGRCVEQYGTGEAYLPFLDAIGSLLTGASRERIVALLRTYAPTWCLQFPAAFVSSMALEKLQQETGGATKERMLREKGDMLAALAANSPIVLLIEDLHWADPSSIDLLRHLSQRIGDQRLLILGTLRQEDIELNDHPLKLYKVEMQTHNLCEEIVLGALTEKQIVSYLDAQFKPNDFPYELSALIHQKTEGHPLFVTSLVQFLVERGDIANAGKGWSLARPFSEMDMEAPENVRGMIRKKIEALGEEDRRALQYASVEGSEFLSTVVAKLLGADDLELEERLAHLDRVYRLIQTVGEEELPDGSLATRYRFVHALYQNVLYGELVSKRRLLLHRQAGEQLAGHYGKQSARIAAQLAMHFERGRDFARALEYLTLSGDNAVKLYANAEAAEHYSRAIGLAEKVTEEERAGKLLTLYQKRGKASMALGRFGQAVEDYTEMLDAARSLGLPEQESAALNALTITLFYSHRLDEITARADEILRTAERAQSDALRIEALQVLALKHLGDGELAEAKPMLDEIIQKARVLEHKPVLLTGLAWRSILHFFQTEYALAEEMLAEVRSLAKELHDSFLLLESYFVLGMVYGNQGRMSEALATLREGIEIAERYGDQFWSPRMPNCLGWVYRELQDFEQAIKYDQQGLEVGRKGNVLEAQANSLINLGIDHRHVGESEKTVTAFEEVESIFQRDTWFRWRYNIRFQAGRCEHWLAQGEFAEAEDCARRLLEIATHYGARKYVALAHKLLAEISISRGDTPTAEAELSAALSQLQTHPVPILEWKTQACLGRLRVQSGDNEGASEALARAAETINGIAAGLQDEELRASFLNSRAVREVIER